MYDTIHKSEEALLQVSIKKGKILLGNDEQDAGNIKYGDLRSGNLFLNTEYNNTKVFQFSCALRLANMVQGIHVSEDINETVSTYLKFLRPLNISPRTLKLLGFYLFVPESSRSRKSKLRAYVLPIPKSSNYLIIYFGAGSDPDAISKICIGGDPSIDKSSIVEGLRLKHIHDIQNFIWALSGQEIDIITTITEF